MRRYTFFVVLMIAAMVLGACATPATTTPTAATPAATEVIEATKAPEATEAQTPETEGVKSEITMAGSTTVQPVAEKLGAEFVKLNPEAKITVSGGGSGVGVKSAVEGTTMIGMASRAITEEEKTANPDLKDTVIARDGIAIIVHPEVKVDDISKEQAAEIFMGKITNWKELGGDDQPIVLVSREEGSGTRGAFQEMVMGKNDKGEENVIADTAILQSSNGALLTTVSTTPNSIGYLSMGYLDASVKALKMGGVEATEENAKNGSYPIVRPLNLLTKGEPTGDVKTFIDWILSEAGQAIVKENGYITVGK